jgi:hypothetical protein
LEWDVSRHYEQGQPVGEPFLEYRQIWAEDPEEAAEKRVEAGDCGEGMTAVCHAIVLGNDQPEFFVVYGELVPEYQAAADDRWEQQAHQIAARCGITLPDKLRPRRYDKPQAPGATP